MPTEQTKAMVEAGLITIVGVLAGIGTSSWCVGLAAAIALFVVIAKGR